MALARHDPWRQSPGLATWVVRYAAVVQATGARAAIAVMVGAIAVFGRPSRAWGQEGNPALDQYLKRIGIDAQQRATAARGRAVAKLLVTDDHRDVTVFGMIGVNVPGDTLVARGLHVERFLAARDSQVHAFANPPSSADVRHVAFDESEYRDLRNCRRGNCKFKLPAASMKEFVEEVDWSSREAKAQADERLRVGMLRLVADYADRGNAGMVTYDDVRGVKSGDVFAALLAQSTDLYEYAPGLEHYLTTYPTDLPDGARDFLYWSEDRLARLRPTLTLNHVVVYAPRPDSAVFIARKQIYATHYFEGALELLAIVDAGDASGEPGAYVLTVRRFRFDNLPGGLFNIRGRVRRQLMEATRADLERQRSSMQQHPYRPPSDVDATRTLRSGGSTPIR